MSKNTELKKIVYQYLISNNYPIKLEHIRKATANKGRVNKSYWFNLTPQDLKNNFSLILVEKEIIYLFYIPNNSLFERQELIDNMFIRKDESNWRDLLIENNNCIFIDKYSKNKQNYNKWLVGIFKVNYENKQLIKLID